MQSKHFEDKSLKQVLKFHARMCHHGQHLDHIV